MPTTHPCAHRSHTRAHHSHVRTPPKLSVATIYMHRYFQSGNRSAAHPALAAARGAASRCGLLLSRLLFRCGLLRRLLHLVGRATAPLPAARSGRRWAHLLRCLLRHLTLGPLSMLLGGGSGGGGSGGGGGGDLFRKGCGVLLIGNLLRLLGCALLLFQLCGGLCRLCLGSRLGRLLFTHETVGHARRHLRRRLLSCQPDSLLGGREALQPQLNCLLLGLLGRSLSLLHCLDCRGSVLGSLRNELGRGLSEGLLLG
mmetsp:Transcript_81909/g.163078  ORF Transcript_81909/g.163078 Transcript_81909/m.163078 type:complete len:256 (+) Transcript_81909:391-1158(+)